MPPPTLITPTLQGRFVPLPRARRGAKVSTPTEESACFRKFATGNSGPFQPTDSFIITLHYKRCPHLSPGGGWAGRGWNAVHTRGAEWTRPQPLRSAKSPLFFVSRFPRSFARPPRFQLGEEKRRGMVEEGGRDALVTAPLPPNYCKLPCPIGKHETRCRPTGPATRPRAADAVAWWRFSRFPKKLVLPEVLPGMSGSSEIPFPVLRPNAGKVVLRERLPHRGHSVAPRMSLAPIGLCQTSPLLPPGPACIRQGRQGSHYPGRGRGRHHRASASRSLPGTTNFSIGRKKLATGVRPPQPVSD